MVNRFSFGILAVSAALIFAALLLGKNGDGATVDNGKPTDGAFRDGLYLGNLAAVRHEDRHIAVARWSSASDRQSFASGYERACTEQLAHDSSAVAQSTNAAYRDGLYQGKLDAEQGRPVHVAVGRWSRTDDRNSYNQGYLQAHETIVAARAAGPRLSQASLLP